MRKYISIILSAAIITGIPGCMSRASAPNTPAEETRSTREKIKPTAEPSAEAPETAEAPGQTTESLTDTKETQPKSSSDVVLLDFDGTPIDTTDTSTYYVSDNGGYWKDYVVDGFAWLAEPRGFAVVSLDGTDPEPPEFTPAEFKRYKTGDTICGLMITKAETIVETLYSDSFFNGCRVEFDGTAEITGYIYYVTESVFLEDEGDLMFAPTAEGCTLPVLYNATVNSFSNPRETFTNELRWGNEYDRIFALGNSDGYAGEDWLSLIPQDGTPVKVKATVNNITAEYLNDSRKSGNGYYRAEIQSLELV